MSKKHLSLKSKILIIVGATFLAVAITIAILFVSGVFHKHHKHDINTEWIYETTKEWTCYEDGIRVGTCNICGESKTEYVSASGHNQIWVVKEEGDCFTDRIENLVCSRCNLIYETRTIPASHDNSDEGFCLKCNQWIINIVLPDTPIMVHRASSNGDIIDTLKITNMKINAIRHRYSGYDVYISWEGEKIYDRNGNNHSDELEFGYKLLDSDGYVIKTGNEYTDISLCVGEKFHAQHFSFSANLELNQTYILEILNIKY